MKRALGRDLNPAGKEGFEVEDEIGREPRARLRPCLNEKVHVAVNASFIPRHRPEDADVPRAVPFSDVADLLSVGFKRSVHLRGG